jgi:hypothetical protein
MIFRAIQTLSVGLAVGVVLAQVMVSGQQKPLPKFDDLPDWSGIWQMQGGTIFDAATVEPKGGRSGEPGVRERPPYTPEFEKLYLRNIDLIAKGRLPDPVNTCGTPHGFPRAMNLPDVYEFVVRPEQTWIIGENGPNIIRIYTDGRPHPAPDDMWPTYSGDSVGRWEGDTLVFDNVSSKGFLIDEDVIVDRTGLILSEKLHVVTRMRKIDESTIEAQMTLEDEKALTKPWVVTKRYRKAPEGTRAYDYSCAENNRNPTTDSGRTLTLGPDGKPLDKNTD